MIVRAWIAAAVVGLSVAATPAFAQQPSLGDLARAEEARRAAASKPKKSYTNSNLNPAPVDVPSGDEAKKEEGCYESVSQQKCVPAEQVVETSLTNPKPGENAPKEEVIRQEAQSIRDELNRLEHEIKAATVLVTSANKREQATQQLNMLRPQMERTQKRWARLEKTVKDLRLPMAWLEPLPTNAVTRQ